MRLFAWLHVPHQSSVVQVCSRATPKQQCSGQNAFPTLWCRSAKQAHSRHCVTAVAAMEILLSVQVCSDATLLHCSNDQSVMHFLLFSAALQSRLTAGAVSLQLHLWRFAHHTGVHECILPSVWHSNVCSSKVVMLAKISNKPCCFCLCFHVCLQVLPALISTLSAIILP